MSEIPNLLVHYGPWGIGAAVIYVILRGLIAKGYGIKIDIGPRPRGK